jgi:hypothetical protein
VEAVKRKDIVMTTLSTRLENVRAELTENEALLEMLDTNAATESLEWGIATASSLVERADGLDDETADQELQPSLRAVRQIMHTIGNWSVGKYPDHSSRLESRNMLLESLKLIFIDNAYLPTPEEMDNLLNMVDDTENSPQ